MYFQLVSLTSLEEYFGNNVGFLENYFKVKDK